MVVPARTTVPIATWPGPVHARPFHSALVSMPDTSCIVRAGVGSAHATVLEDTKLAVRKCAMRLDPPWIGAGWLGRQRQSDMTGNRYLHESLHPGPVSDAPCKFPHKALKHARSSSRLLFESTLAVRPASRLRRVCGARRAANSSRRHRCLEMHAPSWCQNSHVP